MSALLIVGKEVRARLTAGLSLLGRLATAFEAVMSVAEERQRSTLDEVLGVLHAEVERHFEFERRVLVPLLRESDAWGPVRVDRLLEAHEAEEEALRVLRAHLRDGTRTMTEISSDGARFVARLKKDMDEQAKLLSVEIVGGGPMIDQIDG